MYFWYNLPFHRLYGRLKLCAFLSCILCPGAAEHAHHCSSDLCIALFLRERSRDFNRFIEVDFKLFVLSRSAFRDVSCSVMLTWARFMCTATLTLYRSDPRMVPLRPMPVRDIRRLFDMARFRLTAECWPTFALSRIVARIYTAKVNRVKPVLPATIHIEINTRKAAGNLSPIQNSMPQ